MAQRNNLERALSGTPVPDQGSPAPTTTNESGDLFSFVTPTAFVELPSRGRFYGEGHPLHQAETVEIRHMTAKEEDILTSEALLKKGLAVDRMLQSVLVDKSIKIADLLVGDKNAIIVASRITGFGADYSTRVTCPSCTEILDHSFNLEELDLVDRHELPENVKLQPNGNFEIQLKSIDFAVEVRLLTGEDETKWSKSKEKRKKLKLPDINITAQLKLILASVAGFTDDSHIAQFIDALPTKTSREIRNAYEAVMPNVDLTQDFVCTECDFGGRIPVPLTADFFWPDE
tara:strand:+ start:1912 stop:2775 length:864 start_codon:yes stop_codon:yes gene_type:complete